MTIINTNIFISIFTSFIKNPIPQRQIQRTPTIKLLPAHIVIVTSTNNNTNTCIFSDINPRNFDINLHLLFIYFTKTEQTYHCLLYSFITTIPVRTQALFHANCLVFQTQTPLYMQLPEADNQSSHAGPSHQPPPAAATSHMPYHELHT